MGSEPLSCGCQRLGYRLPCRVERHRPSEAPTRYSDPALVDRRMGGEHPQGLIAVGKHHRVSDLHLILNDGVNRPRVEGVDPEDADSGIQPSDYVLMVVAPPVEAAMDCHHTRHRPIARLLGDQQGAEDRVFHCLVHLAEYVVDLEWACGGVGDLPETAFGQVLRVLHDPPETTIWFLSFRGLTR